MAEAKPRERSLWGVVWSGGLLIAGLVVAAIAFVWRREAVHVDVTSVGGRA